MYKKTGSAAKRSASEEAARKERAKGARAASLFKIGLNIANSVSVIAEVLATKYNVSWLCSRR